MASIYINGKCYHVVHNRLEKNHNVQYWTDGKYRCYGDVEVGLIWEKRFKCI